MGFAATSDVSRLPPTLPILLPPPPYQLIFNLRLKGHKPLNVYLPRFKHKILSSRFVYFSSLDMRATCWRVTCYVHLKDRGADLQARIVFNYANTDWCIAHWMIHTRWKSNVNLSERGFVNFSIKIQPTCRAGWEEKTHFNIQYLFPFNSKVDIFKETL